MKTGPHTHSRAAAPACRVGKIVFACTCLLTALQSAAAMTPAMYGIDSAKSWVRVLVYRGGLLSKLGHNHVITHRNIRGCLDMASTLYDSRVLAELDVNGFLVDDDDQRAVAGDEFPGSVPPKDRSATRENLLGSALLDAQQFPRIRLTSASMSGVFPQIQMSATVHIQDRRVPITVAMTLQLHGNSVVASGSLPLDHQQLGLRPFTAALGTLRVRSAMELQFSVVSQRLEATPEISDCERALAVVDNDDPTVFDQTTK